MAEAMSDSPAEERQVTYEELAQIELDFDDIDTEIMARQELLSRPTYASRAALTAKIPNFWPLVFEQAPPEIDSYIQPSDSQVFAQCLRSFTVSRFETPDTLPSAPTTVADFGEPRSLLFRFEFAENEWFTDAALEKKFYYRRSSSGWTGRVSDPVKINWKKGKDLTDGLLDAAVKLFEAETAASTNSSKSSKAKPLPEWEALRKKVDKSTEGSQSFFTFFGYRGPRVSADESTAASKAQLEKREKARKGIKTDVSEEDDEADEAFQERIGKDAEVEIFPDGEDLAVALAEDLWTMALKYFTTAQEDGGEGSDGSGLEDWSDEEGSEEDGGVPDLRKLVKGELRSDGGAGGPPSKKQRKN